MKKIALSLAAIALVAAVAIGATTAYFSDTETSSGNTFTAGAIDLGIDNESYYNGEYNDGTSWDLTYDLDDQNGPYFYFYFKDLKPGDWGEDTISLHVNDNPAWVCAEITLTSDNENEITEPEMDMNDTDIEGELDDSIVFTWWADDGDNVLESDEKFIIPSGRLGSLDVGQTITVAIADSNVNIFDPTGGGPLNGCDNPQECTYYIGKAWCFGQLAVNPVPEGQGEDPTVSPGIYCDGQPVTNLSQSDSMTANISFRAVQARNNADFTCNGITPYPYSEPYPEP